MGDVRNKRNGSCISINGKKLDELLEKKNKKRAEASEMIRNEKGYIASCIRQNRMNQYACMELLGRLQADPSEIDADFSIFGWSELELAVPEVEEVEEQIGEQRSFDFIEEDDGRISRDDLIEGLNNSYLAINDEQKKQTKGIYMIYNLLKEKL